MPLQPLKNGWLINPDAIIAVHHAGIDWVAEFTSGKTLNLTEDQVAELAAAFPPSEPAPSTSRSSASSSSRSSS